MPFAPTRDVAPPTRRANNVGSLVTTAEVITGERMAPISFRPEKCGPGETYDPCAGDTKTVPEGVDKQTWYPYWLVEGDDCNRSDGPGVFEETRARAQRALEVNTSFLIERAFWTGLVNNVVPTDANPALADTAAFQPNGTVAVGLTTGLWDIIEYFNDTIGGSIGFVHVEQRVVPFLMFYGLATVDGRFLRVAGTDHLFVAGTGYPGTDPSGNAPAAGESWIYGTSPVAVRMDGITVVPSLESEALDRADNTIEVRAERLAVAYWDGCAHVGTAVCLEDPGPECAAGS